MVLAKAAKLVAKSAKDDPKSYRLGVKHIFPLASSRVLAEAVNQSPKTFGRNFVVNRILILLFWQQLHRIN